MGQRLGVSALLHQQSNKSGVFYLRICQKSRLRQINVFFLFKIPECWTCWCGEGPSLSAGRLQSCVALENSALF